MALAVSYRLRVGPLTVDGYRIEPLSMQTWDAFADLAERHDGLITRPVALKLPHHGSARAGLAESSQYRG